MEQKMAIERLSLPCGNIAYVDLELLLQWPDSWLKKGEIFPVRNQKDNSICLLVKKSSSYLQLLQDAMFYLPIENVTHEILDVDELERIGDDIYASVEEYRLKAHGQSGLDISGEGDDFFALSGEGSNVARIVDLLLKDAIKSEASDIHLFPHDHRIECRYRIDGVLHLKHEFAGEYKHGILARIKVLANMNVSETRRPQDGSMKYSFGSNVVDMRISTIPISYGEKMVIRIMGSNAEVKDIRALGMDKEDADYLIQQASRPERMILVTGPTGSGKTTTLYSLLNYIAQGAKNIVTVEDPVEKLLPGIVQIGVNPTLGLTFAVALKHILRQDPDVIMLGELRDTEVAEVSVQAAMTGHLVLGTLHTVDAPSAAVRLLDMGIEPWLISSVVACVVAQRLVRTICDQCKKKADQTDAAMEAMGLTAEQCWVGEGCKECLSSGYKGRIAIFEIFKFDDKMIQLFNKGNVDANMLRSAALKQGMVSMQQKGRDLVLQGLTTPEEVLRVTSI